MLKKILRIVSFMLALTLFVGCFSATRGFADSTVAETEEERIAALINSTYKKALKHTNRTSFHGWCGAAVDWQLYILGIIDKVTGSNGNAKFDQYRYKDYSSGGYTIDAYPASKYSLQSSLNAITNNGTKDAYNIMIGFQWTNTPAGRHYGHAVFIYAILDGVVYFAESFSLTMAGKYIPEGTCGTATIAEFSRYFNAWCRFDGAIVFGHKTYNDECQFLSANLYATVTQPTVLYSAPCTPDVDSRSEVQRQLQAGERLNVIGMYRNTEGEYWYEVEDTDIGYVLASDTEMLSLRYEDVAIADVKVPTVMTEGGSFNIRGSVTSSYSEIVSVRAQVFAVEADGMTHVMTTNAGVIDNDYDLYRSTVAKGLKFKSLDQGSYHLELAVVMCNHFYADGDLQSDWQTVKLWKSDFQVVARKGQTASVIFDAGDGISELDAAEMTLGQPLQSLPVAEREGYLFDGWYTAEGELVDETYVLQGGMTLYAHWVEDSEVTGWFYQEDRLYYVQNGIRPQDFFQVDGVTYHHNAEGLLDIGWAEIDGVQYYFHINGAMAVGWLPMEDATYYMATDGTKTTGWAEIDGNTYYFDANGRMVTGVRIIDGVKCTFGDDGVLIKKVGMIIAGPNDQVMSPCEITRGDLFFFR